MTVVWMAAWMMAGGAPARAQDPGCTSHGYQADAIKERLRRWRGMAAFNRWRLIRAEPGPCVVDGKIDVLLVLAPPADWSRRRVPYRVSTRIQLDGSSGAPLAGPEKGFRLLATGIRRLILRAEEHEDVDRFLERYSPRQADITGANGADTLKVTYLAEPRAGHSVQKAPRLVFSEAVENGVAAYQIPRMDGLPVRRELLRIVEVMSKKHPRCRPVWIEARLENGKPGESSARPAGASRPEEPPVQWNFQIDLQGDGCPGFISGVVTDEYRVEDFKVQIPEPRTQ